jgi:hypothetical protein
LGPTLVGAGELAEFRAEHVGLIAAKRVET